MHVYDSVRGRGYTWDIDRWHIVALDPTAGTVEEVPIELPGNLTPNIRGLAFDPNRDRLHVVTAEASFGYFELAAEVAAYVGLVSVNHWYPTSLAFDPASNTLYTLAQPNGIWALGNRHRYGRNSADRSC